MSRYNPKELEPKWQKIWEDTKLFEVTEDPSKPKSYVIDMFPYPSGAGLHVGHVRNFSISDTQALYQRQQGKNVLRTIGFDAFGLPTENYAIKTGVSPQEATAKNVEIFKGQLKKLGMSYDWSREVLTTDPSYYKWTQWIFTQLYKNDLAYQKENLQWWCEHDQTVLADEQVINGRCWRCENPVEKKALKQWFFKITDYADRLLNGLEDLDWPEKIKIQQRNWIGKSVGAEIEFKLNGGPQDALTVFTTRADTLAGATFLVVSPELAQTWVSDGWKAPVEAVQYIQDSLGKSEIERQETDRKKTGVDTEIVAVNPLTKAEIPVWVADYVLGGYGTGAIMAVPAHDQRDYDFAKAFELPIKTVIEPITGTPQENPVFRRSIVALVEDPETGDVLSIKWNTQHGENYLLVGGGVEEGEDLVEAARREIAEETGYTDIEFIEQMENVHHSYFASAKNIPREIIATGLKFKLKSHDKQPLQLEENEQGRMIAEWLTPQQFSNFAKDELHQRVFERLKFGTIYSGEGIMANSGDYNSLSSSEAREKITAEVGTERVNYKMRDWLISRQRYWGAPIPIIHCPKCGAVPVPEDQLPVELPELESYQPSGDGRSALARAEEWLHVDCPQCGGKAERETDTMDGYACSSWYFLRYADPKNDTAAFDRDKVDYWLPVDTYVGGDHAVAHLLYARFWTMFLKDQGLVGFDEPFKGLRYNGYILAPDGLKMSKSKGNVVNPNDLIDEGYGADALRMYELFIGPYEQNVNWNPTGIDGTKRFLNRVWALAQDHLEARGESVSGDSKLETALAVATHKAIKKVTVDLESFSFNTAIAAMMEAVNEMYKLKTELPLGSEGWNQSLRLLVQILAPFAPHITEELWQQLGGETSVHIASWPAFDEKLVQDELVTVVVQVNGKVRGKLEVGADATEGEVRGLAHEIESVKAHLDGKEIVKTIYVPGKILNMVLA